MPLSLFLAVFGDDEIIGEHAALFRLAGYSGHFCITVQSQPFWQIKFQTHGKIVGLSKFFLPFRQLIVIRKQEDKILADLYLMKKSLLNFLETKCQYILKNDSNKQDKKAKH